MATLKQAGKILEIFGDTPAWKLQKLLASGFLTDLRDAPNIGGIDREAFREVVRIGGFILHINRSVPFNPAKFLGEGWSIWRGPADGDGLSGDEDQDQRSLAITELDLSKIQLVTCLHGKEPYIRGEEKILRLKEAGHIRLDANVFQTLWNNKDKIPESWKGKTNGNITYVFFDGTILRGPGGRRFVLFVFWFGGEWYWRCFWLDGGCGSDDPSAVLASPAVA